MADPPALDHAGRAAGALVLAGLAARSLEPISTLADPRKRRAAFRAVLEDGRAVKVRSLRDARHAWRCEWMRRGLPVAELPPVLFRAGSVIVEEWAPGEPWGALPGAAGEAQVAALGAILGRLHALEDVRGRPVRASRPTRRWAAQAAARLARLAAGGAIDAGSVEALLAALRRTDPGAAEVGIAHGDFCLENAVRAPDGRVFVVDNEDIHVGALDYDLGLVWYRWPMPDAEFRRFLDAYAAASGRRPGADLTFWRVAAVVKGAAVRARAVPSSAGVALARLRALAAEVAAP